MARPRFLPDNFTLMLVATVALASFLPAHGEGEVAFNLLTNVAIAALFFLHGAKLSREAVLAGATHWRLHLLVFASTFVIFPIIGVALKPALSWMVTPELYLGILFLCTLPATVQSAIAFTSMARGNVPAAVCSASASSLFGIFITPVLVGLIVVHHDGSGGASPFDSIGNIMLQLLVPFIAGQLSRKAIGKWVERNRGLLKVVDQGSILLVVYTAFSEAVNTGLWHQIPPLALLGLLGCCAVILAVMLAITTYSARWLGFSREDEITIVFCGSKKSLASGIPMAKVLFATGPLGAIVLPLMLFHQMQLMVCAVLAQRYANRQRAAQAAGSVKAGAGKAVPGAKPGKSDGSSANAGAGR
ncbi:MULTISPECIES: bile acid:sodium symporter family protein [Pandoraea]|uniref:bile acid:sodium symporter family protein n=1 Tax=Pandoraea TaxID=93217 RepID=UPI001F5DBB25|nr:MULTISPECIES: bile acid:sodium symporter family protein [Pandoraea]MCI3205189.1 bile acid:sodium symporter [Pandoraea sp. LA3]MDN4583217.1 bile acid:sodium symporter [Pandoraea capi]